jgi:hypothetical protein
MARPNHPVHLHAQAAQGFDVYHADKARPDDRSTDSGDRSRYLVSTYTHRFEEDFVREVPTVGVALVPRLGWALS